jgi:microcompartment protein CcmK/EutM
MTEPNRFEERLLVELEAVVAARPTPATPEPTPRRRPRARVAVAGTVGAVALTAVAIVSGSGSAPPAAYAVQPQAGGEVAVSINSLSDPAGLSRSLHAAGIPAVVDYRPANQRHCRGIAKIVTARTTELNRALYRKLVMVQRLLAKSESSAGASYEIEPDRIGAGERLYVSTSDGSVDTLAMAISNNAQAARCVAYLPVGAGATQSSLRAGSGGQ